MLPEQVRNSLGVVDENARGAVKILEQAGMQFLKQMDPFDGGPYYGGEIENLAPVKSFATYRAMKGESAEKQGIRYLISREDGGGFRAVAAAAAVDNRRMIIPGATLDILRTKNGDRIDAAPLP
jgi:arginine N-succinyltransferase